MSLQVKDKGYVDIWTEKKSSQKVNMAHYTHIRMKQHALRYFILIYKYLNINA